MELKSIFSNIAQSGEEEQFNLLAKSPNCRVERIVSAGHSSPKGFWYDQENDEFIMLVQGEATLEFEDKMVDMKAGDYMVIHKNTKHRIEKSSMEPACIWLCVFDIE
ncbi:MAG: cupin domain-containing protein [Odoribacter sp.]|nr:cupin domain-containing protein [Odoribacter sp.]MDY3034038.1 cupin domain-containing protein [Odoribacter sp.]